MRGNVAKAFAGTISQINIFVSIPNLLNIAGNDVQLNSNQIRNINHEDETIQHMSRFILGNSFDKKT